MPTAQFRSDLSPHLCATHALQGELEVVLTLEGQQVPATVRPAAPELAAAAAPGAGQALEVQLPHRILLVRDAGGSSAQLVHAEVDSERVALQVLSRGPRHLRLQHCGAQRLVALDAPAAAQLTRSMPAPAMEDFSKVGSGGGRGDDWGGLAGRAGEQRCNHAMLTPE